MSDGEYRYRKGVHGEHCVDFGHVTFVRESTIARACTEEEARTLVTELNGLKSQIPESQKEGK